MRDDPLASGVPLEDKVPVDLGAAGPIRTLARGETLRVVGDEGGIRDPVGAQSSGNRAPLGKIRNKSLGELNGSRPVAMHPQLPGKKSCLPG